MARLKVKLLKLKAGKPVAILHKKFAEKSTIHVGERVIINGNKKTITAIIDTATGFLNEKEVVLSNEVVERLKIDEDDFVEVSQAPKPRTISFIHKKLEGKKLGKEELKKIMYDIANNNLTEAEIAYFITAVYKEGMTMKETADMTRAMVETGEKLNLRGKIVDKHSIGGIPGRLTPIIVSICSAAGLKMPKNSSRAITTASGTADAMETICKVDFKPKEIKKILKKTNATLIWGGSLNLAPVDEEIIRVEKILNIDPVPQLLSSILAKKLAINAKYVLINIPYGKNAKVTKKQAGKLKRKFSKLAKHFNMHIKCFLNNVKEPYGNGIGPALEIRDSIKVLKRESSCHNLEKKALILSGKILEMTGKAKKGKGRKKAKEILDSGRAFEKFKQIIKAQKGSLKNLNKIKQARFKKIIRSEKKGRVKEINIKEINSLARMAGCPLDKSAGIYLHKHLKDKVKKQEKLLTIYAKTEQELEHAVRYYKEVKPVRIN